MKTWRLSAGTASVLGIKRVKSEALPTTAYVMLGEKCRNNCRFCAQASSSQARDGFLSRVTWPAVPGEEAAAGICTAYRQGRLKRVCLQAVDCEDSWDGAKTALQALKAGGVRHVCVSSRFETVREAAELLADGAEKVCLAMDAATPAVYRRAKGGDWHCRFALLQACARAFPGRITTHLIVGLGETEQEAVAFIAACREMDVTVGLFAFTPVRGTALAKEKPPALDAYRRVQIAHYLLRAGQDRSVIEFSGGRISGIDLPGWTTLLADGKAFETSGCPDCNRPYYNERPGGVMYNYPQPLTRREAAQALAQSGIGGGS